MFKKEPQHLGRADLDPVGLNEAQKQRRLMQIEEDRRNYYETDLKQFQQSPVGEPGRRTTLEYYQTN